MKKILVPCDFSSPAEEAFHFAVNLAKKSGGSISLLHAIEMPVLAYGASIDIPVYTFDAELLAALKEAAIKRFKKLTAKYSKGFDRTQLTVLQGTPFQTIREFAVDKKIDLVIMGTHGTSGLHEFFVGSNTEKIVRFSKVPVLVIRKSVSVSSIKNIVVPVSLGKDQSYFINKLKDLQIFFDARLHLLYLNTPFDFIRDKELEDFAKLHKLSNYTVNIRNERYELDGIISFTKEVNGDMLAMGTHKRKGLAHLMQGSITEDVVNHATCPIWTSGLKRT